MKVPLLDLRPPLEELRDEIVEAVTQVIDSTCYIMGPEIERLEKEIAEYCGTADAVGASSGTDALLHPQYRNIQQFLFPVSQFPDP